MSTHTPKRENFFEMLAEYIMAGFTVAVIVSAMLIGFIALIAMINYLFDALFGMNFQHHGLHLLPNRLVAGDPEQRGYAGR